MQLLLDCELPDRVAKLLIYLIKLAWRVCSSTTAISGRRLQYSLEWRCHRGADRCVLPVRRLPGPQCRCWQRCAIAARCARHRRHACHRHVQPLNDVGHARPPRSPIPVARCLPDHGVVVLSHQRRYCCLRRRHCCCRDASICQHRTRHLLHLCASCHIAFLPLHLHRGAAEFASGRGPHDFRGRLAGRRSWVARRPVD